MKLLSLFFLIPALIFESSLTTLPLVFIVLLCLTVIFRKNFIFGFAFLFGLLIDLISFKTLGISSIYFLIFLFLVLIYQSKFEITTNSFVVVASFLGSFLYLLLFSHGDLIIFQAIASAIIGLLIFLFLKRIEGKSKFSIYNS